MAREDRLLVKQQGGRPAEVDADAFATKPGEWYLILLVGGEVMKLL